MQALFPLVLACYTFLCPCMFNSSVSLCLGKFPIVSFQDRIDSDNLGLLIGEFNLIYIGCVLMYLDINSHFLFCVFYLYFCFSFFSPFLFPVRLAKKCLIPTFFLPGVKAIHCLSDFRGDL